MIVSVKQHTTTVAKVVNPLGTVVTVQSDDDYEVEVPEDIVIHENCDEALFRPVVASKALVFSEPKIITNALPMTQTAIVESPFMTGKSPSNSKTISTLNNKKYAINNKNNCNEALQYSNNKAATKATKRVDKEKTLLQNEAIKYKRNISKHTNNDDPDPDLRTPHVSNSKFQTCDFSDPFDDVTLKKSDYFIDCGFNQSSTYNKDTESQSSSKNNLHLTEDTKVWKDMSYEYTFEENEKQLHKDFTCFESNTNNKCNMYPALDSKTTSHIDDEKQSSLTRKVRKPKQKLISRLNKVVTDAVDSGKSDDEPIECTVTLKKTWSSVAASKPKEDLTSNQLDKLETNILDQQIDIDNISDNSLLKIYKSDDEKQENGSHSETTESDDSSKVVKLIAMDTEEDACQSESTKNNDLQAASSKSNGKKKPKKKRR